MLSVWWKNPHGLKTRNKNSLNLNNLVQLTAVCWTLSPAGLCAACHLQCILWEPGVQAQAAHGHGMAAPGNQAASPQSSWRETLVGTLKGHIELQHFQRQLANYSRLKRKRKTNKKKDTQTVFLCNKGTVLLRSLFNTLGGLGRAWIKGFTEELNMNLSGFRRNAHLWKLTEHCISCRWDTQLPQDEHVHQCCRAALPAGQKAAGAPWTRTAFVPVPWAAPAPPGVSCAAWWWAPLQLHSKPLPFTLVPSEPEENTWSCRDRGKGRQH